MSFHPSFTLFFMALIGPPNRGFVRQDPLLDTNAVQYQFDNFSLVLLWSFLGLPSHNTGESIHFETTKFGDGLPEEQIDWMRNLSEGVDEINAVAMWDVYRDMLVEKYLTLLKKNESLNSEMLEALDWARFFATGRTSAKYRKWWKAFSQRAPGQPPPKYRFDRD